jgi:LacI family transcriptional regulator
VVVSNARRWAREVKVTSDDEEVGRVAARHLVAVGARHLHFIDWTRHHVSEMRLRGVREEARDLGVEVSVPTTMPSKPVSLFSWDEATRKILADYLKQLPPQSGIVGMNDHMARRVLRVAGEIGLRPPQDFFLLGVDNLATSADPAEGTISSVELDVEAIGTLALKILLDWIRSGQRPKEMHQKVPPRGVVKRLSTFPSGGEASAVQTAMERIQGGRHLDNTVKTLAGAMGVSRVTLHRQFQAVVGRSPGEVLREEQMKRAEDWLITTHRPIQEIATRCGFSHASAFIRAFRATHEGRSPGVWRTTALLSNGEQKE